MYSSQYGKKIGIYGLGKTGITSYLALASVADLVCYDDAQNAIHKFVTSYGVDYDNDHGNGLNGHIKDLTHDAWQSLDKIIVSPGIPPNHPIFDLAARYNIPTVSDLDIFFEQNKNATLICITGTNGKSTTTALIGHILLSNGLDYHIGGNIGTGVLSLPNNKEGYVIEISSFQLEMMRYFKSNFSILLNITKDHLDRHQNMDNYVELKKQLLYKFTPNGTWIIGIDNDITHKIYNEYHNKKLQNLIIPVSGLKKISNGVSYLDQCLFDLDNQQYLFEEPLQLQGPHNRQNISAAFAVCKSLGLNAIQIINACKTFLGLAHRMQFIGRVSNVNFYNDSKATNADAAKQAILSLDNIYWLAGGIAKEDGINSLRPWINKIKKAYLFGKDQDSFASALHNICAYQICDTLDNAFNQAMLDINFQETQMQNVLLSPAAASYDQFKNFEDRGDQFIGLFKNFSENLR